MSGDTPHSDDIAKLASMVRDKPYGEPPPQKGDVVDNVVTLSEMRSQITGDSAYRSPLDALYSAVRAVESGTFDPDLVVVMMRQDNGDGTVSYMRECAGGEKLLYAGLLVRAQQLIFEED